MSRAILFSINEPGLPGLWELAVTEATRVYNRIGNAALPDGVSPYQMLYGEPPDWTGARPHGALCYAVRPIGERGGDAKTSTVPKLLRSAKFDKRVFTCKYLGEPPGQKGRRCLLIDAEYRDRPRIAVFKDGSVWFDCRNVGGIRVPCAISGSMRSRMKAAADDFVKRHT